MVRLATKKLEWGKGLGFSSMHHARGGRHPEMTGNKSIHFHSRGPRSTQSHGACCAGDGKERAVCGRGIPQARHIDCFWHVWFTLLLPGVVRGNLCARRQEQQKESIQEMLKQAQERKRRQGESMQEKLREWSLKQKAAEGGCKKLGSNPGVSATAPVKEEPWQTPRPTASTDQCHRSEPFRERSREARGMPPRQPASESGPLPKDVRGPLTWLEIGFSLFTGAPSFIRDLCFTKIFAGLSSEEPADHGPSKACDGEAETAFAKVTGAGKVPPTPMSLGLFGKESCLFKMLRASMTIHK